MIHCVERRLWPINSCSVASWVLYVTIWPNHPYITNSVSLSLTGNTTTLCGLINQLLSLITLSLLLPANTASSHLQSTQTRLPTANLVAHLLQSPLQHLTWPPLHHSQSTLSKCAWTGGLHRTPSLAGDDQIKELNPRNKTSWPHDLLQQSTPYQIPKFTISWWSPNCSTNCNLPNRRHNSLTCYPNPSSHLINNPQWHCITLVKSTYKFPLSLSLFSFRQLEHWIRDTQGDEWSTISRGDRT